MGVPSSNNSIINITSSNPSITGVFNISGFLVNSTNQNWAVELQDINGETIFAASQSSTNQVPFGFPLTKSLQIKNITGSTLTNIANVLVYLE